MFSQLFKIELTIVVLGCYLQIFVFLLFLFFISVLLLADLFVLLGFFIFFGLDFRFLNFRFFLFEP